MCFSSRKKKDITKKIVFPYDHLVGVTLKYHRKNNFLIRYYKWTFPQRPPWGQKKVAVVERFKQESFAFSFTWNLWHIIFDRDPDSHFIIDGDLSTALCWSDHQVMVLILLRGTFGVGLQGAPSLLEIRGCISWWILIVSNNVGDSDENRHLTEWIRAASIFIALAPSHSIREMLAFFSGIGY